MAIPQFSIGLLLINVFFLSLLVSSTTIDNQPKSSVNNQTVDDDSLQCWSSWSSYDVTSRNVYSQTTVQTWEVTSSLRCISEPCSERATTTLCDGYPRYVEPPNPGSEMVTYTTTPWLGTITYWGTYTAPTPSCTIPEADCPYFSSLWSSSGNEWDSSSTSLGTAPTWLPADPHCTTYKKCTVPPATKITTSASAPTGEPTESTTTEPEETNVVQPTACLLNADGQAKIYFWPVKTESEGCFTSAPTITPAPTGSGPNIAVVDGTTFTSPFVYMSLDTVSAGIYRGPNLHYRVNDCGHSHTNVLISVHPTAVSSMSGRESSDGPYPFNFADLTGPLRWSAWKSTPWCWRSRTCKVIDPYDWLIPLSLPEAAKALDPEFSGCTANRIYLDETYIAILPPNKTQIVKLPHGQTPYPTTTIG